MADTAVSDTGTVVATSRRDLEPQVKVEPELAARGRVPIDRMIAIG
jgi:hypothetical protein